MFNLDLNQWLMSDPRHLAAFFAAGLTVVGGMALALRYKQNAVLKPKASDIGKDAFAGPKDLIAFGLKPAKGKAYHSGFVIGAEPKTGCLLVDDGEPGLRIQGPTGCGKTKSLLLPTAYFWRGGGVFHDRKLELYRLTQATRHWKFTGLWGPTVRDSLRLNPMSEIPTDDGQIVGVQNMVSLIPQQRQGAADPIWDNNGMALLVSEVLYVLNFEPPEKRNWVGVRDFHAAWPQAAQKMIRQRHPNPFVRKEIRDGAKRILNNGGDKYIGGIIATIDSWLNVFSAPDVAQATSRSDLRLAELVAHPMPGYLFLHLPPRHAKRLAPLARMMIDQLLAAMMEDEYTVDGLPKKHWLMWLLDEFYVLGQMPRFVDALADMRGYQMRPLIAAQGETLLRRLYGADSPIFNTTRLVEFRPFDLVEAKQMADMLGQGDETYFTTNHQPGGRKSITMGTRKAQIASAADVLRFDHGAIHAFGYPKIIRATRPSLDIWASMMDPKPMTPGKWDAPLLPLRAPDGTYRGLPPELPGLPRNPWDSVHHKPEFADDDLPPPPPAPDLASAIDQSVASPDWSDDPGPDEEFAF